MKMLKLILLILILVVSTILIGCQGEQAGYGLTRRKTYQLRADGLRIPTYSYSR